MNKQELQRIQGLRLRQAREALYPVLAEGWAKAKKLTDVSLPTYTQHENGTRGFDARADAYAKAFNVSPAWLLWGTSNMGDAVELPVTGKVAAGHDGLFDSDFVPGDSGQHITFDPGHISLVVEISGDSMAPRYKDREKILLGFQHRDVTPFLRKEVFVQTKSGHKLFKQLRKGSRPGVWDLYSLNADYDPIRDVEIEWVAPVEWHKILS